MKNLLQKYFVFVILLSENEVATYINKKFFNQFEKITQIKGGTIYNVKFQQYEQ